MGTISRCHFFSKLLYVLASFCFVADNALGLKLIEVSIPRHTDLRKNVQLSCKFDIIYGKLYSVKWYKDDFEFFRYMPDNIPRIQTFPVPGVLLDVSRSNMTTITLQQLNFTSTGNYRCEVSKDGPNFETIVRNGNMTVMVYPEDNPFISGIRKRYSIGDDVEGNCTSSWSNPRAQITWYINDRKADTWLLENLETLETNDAALAPVTLYSQGVRLKFQLQKTHFKNGSLKLRCSSKISDLPPREQTFIIQSETPLADGIQAQNRLNNSDCSSFTGNLKWFLMATAATIRYIV